LTDPAAFLDGYAGIMVDVHSRLAPVYEAVRGAASADPEAREVWETVVAERLGGARNVVAGVKARGACGRASTRSLPPTPSGR
jgi:hypothetical protein